MFKWVAFALLHVVMLLLATTNFTLVTGPFRGEWVCNYFSYCYANGWGYVYHSDYSLAQVVAYLVAYGAGVVLFPMVTRPVAVGVVASAVCVVGFVSFGVELTHWGFEHHLSLIFSAPILLWMVTLWAVVYAAMGRSAVRRVAH